MATFDDLRAQVAGLTSGGGGSTKAGSSEIKWGEILRWIGRVLIPWLIARGKQVATFWSNLSKEDQDFLQEFVGDLVRHPSEIRNVDTEARQRVIAILRRGFGLAAS